MGIYYRVAGGEWFSTEIEALASVGINCDHVDSYESLMELLDQHPVETAVVKNRKELRK